MVSAFGFRVYLGPDQPQLRVKRPLYHRQAQRLSGKLAGTMKTMIRLFVTILLALLCLATVERMAQAVVPPPDGGYPNFTTAEGTKALQNLTTGAANTAVGWYSLFANTTASFNTAIGAGALDLNTARNNTAVGAAALLLNTTGNDNTANGVAALAYNGIGTQNTANGAFALFANTTGGANTANGDSSLTNNTTGSFNTASGVNALLFNTTASGNTAMGETALFNSTGDSNTAIGDGAGFNATTGSGNVYVGAGMFGVAGESNACYIASIFGQTSVNGIPILINSDNKLGTVTSSKRFKRDIKPVNEASEALFSLKPVTFRYKKEIDPAGTSQFGLVAEEVEKVNPDLIVRVKEGKPYTVRYDQVNAMLLNEFLKEHRKVEQLEKEVAALTAGLQKVSAQLDVRQAAPQTAVNNR